MTRAPQGQTPLLDVAPGLLLPEDVVTQSLAILAKRRVGKSNTGVVLAEEFHRAGLPFTVIDPKGDWYGMRSSGAGKGPGLPIPILGGLHGDVPLTPESGQLIAELVVGAALSCIIDVSDFATDDDRTRFLTDFGRHLFRLHRLNPQPRHVFLEEADTYIPQQAAGGAIMKCVATWSRLVKQGGAFGLGVTVISQRSAVVHKDVLTQVETMIAMRTSSPQDRKAIGDWLAGHDSAPDIVKSLPGLDNGEAWVISPYWLAGHGQPAVQRVRFRRRRTFDSGATPTMASARQAAAALADIDFGAIAGQMRDLAEQAAADNPDTLRKRIRDLERDLGVARRGLPDDAETEALRRQVAGLAAELERERSRPPLHVPVLTAEDRTAVNLLVSALRGGTERIEAAVTRAAAPALPPAAAVPAVRARSAAKAAPARPRAVPAPAGSGQPEPAEPAAGLPRALKAGARTMLEQLARHHPLKMTRNQLAALSGIKGSGSTFSSYFSALRINGYVTQDGTLVVITPEGMAAAGTAAGAPPLTPDDIRAQWRGVLKAGARTMLDLLLDDYPSPVTRAELGTRAGINPAGSTLSSYLSTLRSNNLITEDKDGVRAADVFFLTEGGTP